MSISQILLADSFLINEIDNMNEETINSDLIRSNAISTIEQLWPPDGDFANNDDLVFIARFWRDIPATALSELAERQRMRDLYNSFNTDSGRN